MGTISTNLRATLNEGINVNQGRDFSDLGAGYTTNPKGFVDDLTQLAMTANNTSLLIINKGCAWVSYEKTNDQAYMKCEMTQNYSLAFADPDGTYFLRIELNTAIFPTGSLVADGSDYFTIKRGPTLPVSGYFCPLYQFSKTGTAIAIIADLREQRDVRFRDIEARDIEARDIDARKITADEIELPSGDLQTTLDTITTLAAGVSLQGLPVMAGEDLSARDDTFIEEYPTYSEATIAQNVGDVSANTRVSAVAFGSGVSGSSIVLKLNKVGTPTPALEVRIETDNLGLPSGTPAHPNAVGTIAQASITGISNYTINFAGSFLITKGQKVHIVIRQVGDVVNAANYYIVYFAEKHTSTRPNGLFNGSSRTLGFGSGQSDTNVNTTSYGTTQGGTNLSGGRRVQAKKNLVVSSVTKTANTDATRARILNDAGVQLTTATFVGNTATFGFSSYVYIPNGTFFRVEMDSNGANYVRNYEISPAVPVVSISIDYIQGSQSGANNANAHAITSIGTIEGNAILSSKFIPTITSVLQGQIFSKTNSFFAYKINQYGLSTINYTAGQDAIVSKQGEINGFVGLIPGAQYFLSPIPGQITTTNTGYFVGTAKNSTTLIVPSSKSMPFVGGFSFASPIGTLTNFLATTITAPANGFLVFKYSIIKTTTNPGTYTGNITFPNGYVFDVTATNTNGNSQNKRGVGLIPMTAGQQYQVLVSKTGLDMTVTGSWDTFISIG